MVLHSLLVGFIVISFCGLSNGASRLGCSLNVLGIKNEKFLPVLLHNESSKFTLVIPEQGHVNLRSGEGITFLCPERNYLVPTHSNFTYVTCIQDTVMKIYRRAYDFNEILCNKPIRGEVQKTRERCGDGYGRIINIGYRVTPKYFISLIKVCYSEEEGRALYSEHTVHGTEVAYTSRFSERPSFSVEGLPKDVSASVAYKRAYQKSTLSSLLGSSREAERYINTKSYLSRGHLSPDADFLFASSQLTSYFYVNTCPQWQSINGGNWVRVETAVRKAAERYQRDFTIITGTHEVLELPDINGNPVPIYLVSRRKLPVPKFIWKIIFDEAEGRAIAFVSFNNPFAEEITEDDMLCDDICGEYGWDSKSFEDVSKGFVYCCDVEELREKIGIIPNIEVNGILRGVSR